MTTVVNIREPHDVYIGRAGRGQDGYLGNPFVVGMDGDRQTVIAKYKVWFWHRVNTDPEFRRRVKELAGKALGCFCKQPGRDVACHGDVIAAWLNAGCPLKETPCN